MVKVQGWAPPGGQNIIQTWKKEARKPKRLGKTWTTVQRATLRLLPLEQVDEVHQPNCHLIDENSDNYHHTVLDSISINIRYLWFPEDPCMLHQFVPGKICFVLLESMNIMKIYE